MAGAPEQQRDTQSSSSSSVKNSEDSEYMNFEELLKGMLLPDVGTSSNEVWSEIIKYIDSNDQGQTKNPASPKALGNTTLENLLTRAGIITDDVQEPPPPQQTRYAKGTMARRRLRILKNRELAAQFRANKQAYNIQLEEELYLLREENKHLKLLMKRGEALARAKCGDATQSETQQQ